MKRINLWMAVATLAAFSGGCVTNNGVTSKKKIPVPARPVAQNATREELLEKYDAIASSVNSLNATVELKTTAGSQYSGLIQEYHEVKAFLLASRPENVRMVGQAPVIGKTIFDMSSDGKEFRVWLPTKNKFLTGEVALERNSDKPLENLRPQHLLDALLWTEIRKEETTLQEEFNDENARYYVLTVLRGGYRPEIFRKIWFDRSNLNVVRLQSFGPKGALLSDVRYSDWQPVSDAPAVSTAASNQQRFPRSLRIERPHDDYRLDLQVAKIELNMDLAADRFQLPQPANAEIVHVTIQRIQTARAGFTSMMGELIFRNLLHRPVRTLIGILAIAVEVALVVLIVGLTSGLLTETAKRIEGIGADIMLQPPGAGYLLGFGTAPMPIKIGDKVKELKYVQEVAPDSAAIEFHRRSRGHLWNRASRVFGRFPAVSFFWKVTISPGLMMFWLMIGPPKPNT